MTSLFFAGNALAIKDLAGIPILLLKGIQVPEGAVLSAGHRIWMDRNLGASQVATSSTDSAAYGDLYQWGRLTDGHENRASADTGIQSAGDIPGHGLFITANADWRSTPNNSLWQGVTGTNNPCPAGFRLPTETELQTERDSWSSADAAGAFTSPLKLVVGGYRYYLNGNPNFVDSNGYYWSSTIAGDLNDVQARYLTFSPINTSINGNNRASGYSIRCIMD